MSKQALAKAFSILTKEQGKLNIPQFVIGTANGFLPRNDPLVHLPPQFKPLDTILNDMPITKNDGSSGLLSKGTFGSTVDHDLPEIDVSEIHDLQLLTALFRDYTFAASAYLLEPCDLLYRKTGKYGLGRDYLPRNLAVPLVKISEKLGTKPFMEYAQSYALYNYKRVIPGNRLEYENLDLIRSFTGMPSEKGFILVHVAMVAHSGNQVKHILEALNAVEMGHTERFTVALRELLTTMQAINNVMDTMWKRSTPEDYMKFRTFIMGTKSQPMFPNGVVYRGTSKEPTFYRGESGANDSIVPTLDNFLQLTEKMPANPLTEILRDFRTYRPSNHNEWLAWLEHQANALQVRKFAMREDYTSFLYLALLDQVREFRNRHWMFTKEYIIKHTRHPVATGGSPIVTWLPNQLKVVLMDMIETGNSIRIDKLQGADREEAFELIKRAKAQHRVLLREVEELGQKFPDQQQA